MTTRRKRQCRHAIAGTGRSCLDWPSPDQLGRKHCKACGCFTASPDRIHPWCRRR